MLYGHEEVLASHPKFAFCSSIDQQLIRYLHFDEHTLACVYGYLWAENPGLHAETVVKTESYQNYAFCE